jgi:hypothetical protein
VPAAGRWRSFDRGEHSLIAYKPRATRRVIAHESERQELIAIAGGVAA